MRKSRYLRARAAARMSSGGAGERASMRSRMAMLLMKCSASWVLPAGLDAGDAAFLPMDALNRCVEDDRAAALFDEVAGAFPHHARAVPRVEELVDEGLNDILLAFGGFAD